MKERKGRGGAGGESIIVANITGPGVRARPPVTRHAPGAARSPGPVITTVEKRILPKHQVRHIDHGQRSQSVTRRKPKINLKMPASQPAS
jgi:hypothetical protein